MSEPYFNTLRTKEQLGYATFCTSIKIGSAVGMQLSVQSAKHPVYVEERIETFLDSMAVNILNNFHGNFTKFQLI